MSENKKPVGRPSEFKKEYCQMLIEHMKQGDSYETFGATIGISRATLYNWEKEHPEFLDAKSMGMDLNFLYWERKGREGMNGTIDKFNATVWVFNMKNRHKWRDKQPDEVDTIVNNNVNQMSDEELKKSIKDKMSKLTPEEIKELLEGKE